MKRTGAAIIATTAVALLAAACSASPPASGSGGAAVANPRRGHGVPGGAGSALCLPDQASRHYQGARAGARTTGSYGGSGRNGEAQ